MRIDRRKFRRRRRNANLHCNHVLDCRPGYQGRSPLPDWRKRTASLSRPGWMQRKSSATGRLWVLCCSRASSRESTLSRSRSVGNRVLSRIRACRMSQVPDGFCHRLRKRAQTVLTALPPDGDYTPCGNSSHDYLYWNQATDKATADLVSEGRNGGFRRLRSASVRGLQRREGRRTKRLTATPP